MFSLKNLAAICLLALLAPACSKTDGPAPLSKSGNPPGPVTDVRVENLPGGARLKYSLPEDDNLLYIKAVYEFPEGNKREVKASLYGDSLIIDGIGSTSEMEVQLYAVSRSEKLSQPVIVKIQPLTPPVQLTGATLTLREDFGGVIAGFENSKEADLVISIIRKDGDEWVPIENYYTKKKSGSFNARGQASESTVFGVFVKDRWNNRSDTLVATLKPLFEEKLPPPVPITTLYNDYNKHYSIHNYTYLFDGIAAPGNYMGTFLNSPESKLPQSFTMDFKKPTTFSRLKYWSVMATGNYFNAGTPEKFEIWGTNTLEADYSYWTKIMDCVAVKPSGKPLGQLTQEDIDVSTTGLDFSFPSNTQPKPYRYLRWKTTKNFGSVDYIQMSEATFWGSQQ